MQVVPNQRPPRRARAADELVEQLDCERNQDGTAGAADEATKLRAGAAHECVSFSDGETAFRPTRRARRLAQRYRVEKTAVDAELRQILEGVAASGPATRAELRDRIERRGGRFSGRAVAEAIRKGLIRPFSEPGEGADTTDREASISAEEAYVLTREGAVALGVDRDA